MRNATIRSMASWAAVLVLVAGWAMFLRPQFLGGPATFVGVSGISMEPTMRDGDLTLVSRRAAYGAGDVIAYRIPAGAPGEGNNVIHRVTGGDGQSGFVTRGDHNSWDDVWRPREHDVLGKVVLRVPGAAGAIGQLREPWVLAPFAGAVAFVAVLWSWRRRPEDADAADAAGAAVRVLPRSNLRPRAIGLTVLVLASASAVGAVQKRRS